MKYCRILQTAQWLRYLRPDVSVILVNLLGALPKSLDREFPAAKESHSIFHVLYKAVYMYLFCIATHL
jgi:hypothetical protein